MKTKLNFFGFSQNVFFLSLISFFNDIGGETIKRAIPLYLTNVLGVKTSVVGLIEGIADATPQLFQPISGYLSDLTQKRKPIIVVGQAMRSIMIFLYAATTWPQVMLLRFLDRTGKGVAGAARDALISVSSEKEHIGRSFGLSRALDNAGAVIGMLLAGGIIYLIGQGATQMTQPIFQRIVLLAVGPLLISLAILVLFIRDVPVAPTRHRLTLHNQLGSKYYLFLFLSLLFTIGNSSDAFIMLKAQRVGISLSTIFFLLAGYSLTASVSGYVLSNLSDKIGRKTLLVSGWFLYAALYFLLAQSVSATHVMMIFVAYGLYYGFTEGSAKALVSDIVEVRRRGTAYGIYNMVTGITLLPASLLAGYLWQTFAPSTAFYVSSATAAAAAVGLLFLL